MIVTHRPAAEAMHWRGCSTLRPLILLVLLFLLSHLLLANASSSIKFNIGSSFPEKGFLPDPVEYLEAEENLVYVSPSLVRAADNDLHRVLASHRYGTKPFRYRFPFGDGAYDIKLYFNDNWEQPQSNDGSLHVFSINIEGKEVIKDLDIVATVGHHTAYSVIVRDVGVQDGDLTITFVPQSSKKSLVSAIELHKHSFEDLASRLLIKVDPKAALIASQAAINAWLGKEAGESEDRGSGGKIGSGGAPGVKNPNSGGSASKGVGGSSTNIQWKGPAGGGSSSKGRGGERKPWMEGTGNGGPGGKRSGNGGKPLMEVTGSGGPGSKGSGSGGKSWTKDFSSGESGGKGEVSGVKPWTKRSSSGRSGDKGTSAGGKPWTKGSSSSESGSKRGVGGAEPWTAGSSSGVSGSKRSGGGGKPWTKGSSGSKSGNTGSGGGRKPWKQGFNKDRSGSKGGGGTKPWTNSASSGGSGSTESGGGGKPWKKGFSSSKSGSKGGVGGAKPWAKGSSNGKSGSKGKGSGAKGFDGRAKSGQKGQSWRGKALGKVKGNGVSRGEGGRPVGRGSGSAVSAGKQGSGGGRSPGKGPGNGGGGADKSRGKSSGSGGLGGKGGGQGGFDGKETGKRAGSGGGKSGSTPSKEGRGGGKASDDRGSGKKQTSGNPGGSTRGFDHQAHAVAGGPYYAVDFDKDGEVTVELNGELSHTHYFKPPDYVGTIVSYKWEKVGGRVLGTKPTITKTFPVGVTDVKLTVIDSEGDVSSVSTTVVGLPSATKGVYCYYYNTPSTTLPKGITSQPKPVQAGEAANIAFYSLKAFSYKGKRSGTWASRCLTSYNAEKGGQYTFALKHNGGVQLFIDGISKLKKFSKGGPTMSSTGPMTLSGGQHSIQLLYYKQSGPAFLVLFVNGKVVPPGSLSYDVNHVLPVINSVVPMKVNADGGGQMVITGSGFFQDVSVGIGAVSATFKKSSDEKLLVKVPSQKQAGGKVSVPVTVTTSGGTSNAKTLTYSAAAAQPVKWTWATLTTKGGANFYLAQGSSITLGSDGNYYIGTLAGVVHKLTINAGLTVTHSCQSEVEKGRAILGVAVNPQDTKLKVYIATSKLYWGTALGTGGWANGKIDVMTPGCGCLCKGRPLITGLPVGNHDHGVNGLFFMNNGDLLIQTGGFTNAGYNNPKNKLGAVSETPLSAASLIAATSKGAAFDGKITYNQYYDPGTALQTGGMVKVRTAGLRNSFGVVQHSNGKVYATDNGPNKNFGQVSTSCSSQSPGINGPDRILQLSAGGYVGHPNRNRGRSDPRQCIYASNKFGLKVESSTDGLIEYTANLFGGSLKGDLIATKYASQGAGKTYRIKLKADGGLASATLMASYSGLSAVMGMRGEIIMPRVGQKKIVVLKPDYKPPKTPFVIAVTPRRGKGGSKVFVTGHNLGGVPITFGGKPCKGVTATADGTQVTCTVPPGSGSVGVSAGWSPKSRGDFIYV